MPDKNNSDSNAPGICQSLFNFFMNSIIARGLKRVTLGQSLPRGYDPSIPAKSSGELMVHHMDHEKSKRNSGSEIRVLFKQSEELESWTPVDPVVPKISDQAGIKTVSEQQQQPSGRKKEIPLAPLEKKEQRRQGKRSDQMKGSEEEDGRKIKGASIASAGLTLPIEGDEEVKRTPRRSLPLSVAPNINEKSDEFIRLQKEAIRMEPKKNP